MSLDEVLTMIRSRPGIILGRKSVDRLEAFLDGFTFATKDLEDHRFLTEFSGWVRRRYHIKSGQGWAKIISFHSTDGADGLDLFWKLLDEYRSRGQGAPDTAGFNREGRNRQRGTGRRNAQPAPERQGHGKAG